MGIVIKNILDKVKMHRDNYTNTTITVTYRYALNFIVTLSNASYRCQILGDSQNHHFLRKFFQDWEKTFLNYRKRSETELF